MVLKLWSGNTTLHQVHGGSRPLSNHNKVLLASVLKSVGGMNGTC